MIPQTCIKPVMNRLVIWEGVTADVDDDIWGNMCERQDEVQNIMGRQIIPSIIESVRAGSNT